MSETLINAKERIDRFRETLAISDRYNLPFHTMIEPVEEPEDTYTMPNPVTKGLEGVGLTIAGILAGLGVLLFGVFMFLGACFVMVLRITVLLAKKLLPVALLIVLLIIGYKLLQY